MKSLPESVAAINQTAAFEPQHESISSLIDHQVKQNPANIEQGDMPAAFSSLPQQVLPTILSNLYPREQAKVRLTSKAFDDAYNALQQDETLTRVMTHKVLAEQLLKADDASLNVIVIDYLQSLSFDLEGHTDFKAYLLSSSPYFWEKSPIKPAELITKLEHCFEITTEVKRLCDEAGGGSDERVLTYYFELSRIEQWLLMLRLHFSTRDSQCWLLPKLFDQLRLIDIIEFHKTLNNIFIYDMVEWYISFLQESEARRGENEKWFCQQVERLFTEASPADVEQLFRLRFGPFAICDLLTTPTLGILRKVDPKTLIRVINSIRDSNKVASLFTINSYFVAEAPIQAIYHACHLSKNSEEDTAISNLLVRKEFFLRCREADEQQQWFELFYKALRNGDLLAKDFISCLEVLKPERHQQAVCDYINNAYCIKCDFSGHTWLLLSSEYVIPYLSVEQMGKLTDALYVNHFAEFLESAALRSWLTEKEPKSTRLLVSDWLERIDQKCPNLSTQSHIIALRQIANQTPSILTLTRCYNIVIRPTRQGRKSCLTEELVQQLDSLTKLELTSGERRRLSAVVHHLTCEATADKKMQATERYKPVVKLLVTNTYLQQYHRADSLYAFAKTYPELASTILEQAADRLSSRQKLKTPSLPRRIIRNMPRTLLHFVANLAITPVYTLAGLALAGLAVGLLMPALVLSLAFLPVLGLISLIKKVMLVKKDMWYYSYTTLLPQSLLSLCIAGVKLPVAQLGYTLWSLSNLSSGRISQCLATADWKEKILLVIGGVLAWREYKNSFDEYKHGRTIADIAANYEKTVVKAELTTPAEQPANQVQLKQSTQETQSHSYSWPTSISTFLLRRANTGTRSTVADSEQQPLLRENLSP